MKQLLVLTLLGGAAWAQTIPPLKGDGPEWDAGTPIESAFLRCRNCHDQQAVIEPAIYMPFDGWVSSMMGNSQRDPLFRAAVAVANQDVPGIGQWCLRCHSPQAYLRGHVLPPDGGALDALDYEGVTCDICHRSIVPANEPGAPFVGNAQLYFDGSLNKYGPYPNVSSPAHAGEPTSFTGSSELCGQCHSVHNPIGPWRSLDGGTLGPSFPLDTTYEEWKQSSFARLPRDAGFASCADCHMPRFTGPDGGTDYKIAKGIGFGPRTNPRQHLLVGGNVWGLDAVQAANPDLALEFADQFAATRKASLQILQSAARLTLTVPAAAQPGPQASVTVRVTNLSGHKLPTGYGDGRRVVVQLSVDGQIVTGAFDGGALLGDAQLRVYEALHGRAAIGVSEHLALHDAVLKDSRIPPAGMVAQPQTQPVAVAWFTAADGGLRDYDEAIFTVPLAPSLANGAKVNVTARLLYQSTIPQYVEFLAAENRTDSAGQRLLQIYNATGRGAPIEMARAEAELTVSRSTGSDAGAGGGAGGGGGGGTGGGGGDLTGSCHCQGGPGIAGLALLALLAAIRARRPSRR